MSHLTPLVLPALLSEKDSPVTWLIPELLPQGSLVALAGEPGAGKSLFSYVLSLALATGRPLLGWPLTPARVAYFDDENGKPDCTQYLRWAWQGLGCPPLDLIDQHLFFYHFHLGHKAWLQTATDAIAQARPQLIVIDTATPSCFIQDENNNAEASQVILRIRALMAMTNPPAAALILKHAKMRVDHGTYSIRGAKAWVGAVDSLVFFVRDVGRPVDHLSRTRLEPAKSRAFGLRRTVSIKPQWTLGHTGISLHTDLTQTNSV